MWYVQKEVFEPEEICISEEISDKAYNSGVNLTKTLDTSPPTYQKLPSLVRKNTITCLFGV